MPYQPVTNHYQRVCQMIAGRSLNPGADAARLVSSYRRALDDYHLDPAATAGPRILTGAELRVIQQGEESLLRAAGLCLPRLHDMVRDAGYCVLLADANGATIDYRVEPTQRRQFKQAGLYLGSCWSEREEGTCGIAAVLLDQAPITVHKTDHFRAAFTTLTCSAAPIFTPGGTLVGVLNASAVQSPDGRDSQRLVNRLVQQSALLIEDGLFLATHGDCWILLAHRDRHYVEVQPEMLIAVDGDGRVVAANRCARACVTGLADTGGAVLRQPVSDLFALRTERLFTVRAGHDLLSLRLAGGGAWLHARVRPPQQRAPARTPITTSRPASAAPRQFDGPALAERNRIVAVMAQTQWRPLLAASQLGISRATLYRRLAQLEIRPPHRQSPQA